MNPWVMILVGGCAMSLVMAALWVWQRRSGDAGIVDVAWGLGIGLLALLFAVGSEEGLVARRVITAALALLWSLRLSGYILIRVMRLPEDGRYQAMKEQWGARAQARLFWFYQAQAGASLLFALPMLVASQNPRPLGIADVIAVLVWIAAIGGESIADRQLARFRGEPGNRGQVCREGLWRYSRHPNYFFEWLHWWTYVLLALGGPWGMATIAAPLVMLFFILKVTGIPPTEAQALRSRGEAYRAYQRSTSSFFPWPPKREETAA